MSGPAGEGGVDLVDRGHLDLDPHGVGHALLDGPDGIGEIETPALQGGQVIVLDQHAVGEVEAMVLAAADADGVLLEDAETRRRLARVDEAGGETAEPLGKRGRHRRDAAQALEEVQGRALRGQERARRALDARRDAAPRDAWHRRAAAMSTVDRRVHQRERLGEDVRRRRARRPA